MGCANAYFFSVLCNVSKDRYTENWLYSSVIRPASCTNLRPNHCRLFIIYKPKNMIINFISDLYFYTKNKFISPT